VAGGDAGGIARAAALLAEHGGAIEADLARYYGLHLGDFPWPLTARRLGVLVEHLPDDSAFRRSVVDEKDRPWTFEAMLLATVVDELRFAQYQAARIAGAKKATPPEPIPRPGVVKRTQHAKPSSRQAAGEAMRRRGIHIPDELRGGD
jgi:hypothetical protein